MGIRARIQRRLLACLLAVAGVGNAIATAPMPAQAPPRSQTDATAAASSTAPALTVAIELAEPLDSSRHKRGDTFALRLLQPVTLPDGTVLPAGLPGRGEVVHADKARSGGKPGELILAARTLDTAQGSYHLRALRLTGTGEDHSGTAVGMSIAAAAATPGAAFLALFIRGGQMVIPAGTRGIAKLDPLLQGTAQVATPAIASPLPPNEEIPQ